MAQGSRWLRLNIDWDDSPWVFSLSEGSQLAWIKFLCYVKALGSKGKVRSLEPLIASRKWGVGEESVTKMLQAAVNDGAIVVHDGVWEVVNWERYQSDDPTAAERQRRCREKASQVQNVTESHGVTLSRATETETETYTETSISLGRGVGKPKPPTPSEKKQDAPAIAVAKPEGKFKEPELSVIQAYGQTIGVSAAECEGFRDHHKARGWVPSGSRTQMKDWQAALRTWKRNTTKFGSKPNPVAGVDEFGSFEVIR